MKNGCGKSFQNDIISVILSQKGENPSLSSLRMRGMGLKRFCSEFLISSLREESATNELANPKLGGKQNAFVLLPQRTQRDSNPQPPTTPTSLSTRRVLYHLRAMRPVILFRTTGWLNHVRGGRTPFTDLGDQCFRGRTNPDHQEKG